METRVRFAPSPTGSLHLGGALTAVANRRFADTQQGRLVLRIDDTDAERADAAAEAGILQDLEWLGVSWDEGPVRQSERIDRHREAARALLEADHAFEDAGSVRLSAEHRPTLLRVDRSATYHLASVVDDIDLGITHVIRGRDHLSNTDVHVAVALGLGVDPPEYVHHGLLVGPDGKKLSKRSGAASVADLREEGIPAEAALAYLVELDLPRHDVHFDRARVERLSIEAISALSDEALSGRVGVPVELAPALRGARSLVEGRRMADEILTPPGAQSLDERGQLTIERLRELRSAGAARLGEAAARSMLREVKAVGGDLKTVRRVLTGVERGPELWTVLYALDQSETLDRVERALT